MRRTITISTTLLVASVSAIAASTPIDKGSQEIIEIRVAPKDLEDCRETLRQVASMPDLRDDGSSTMLEGSQTDVPHVRCVVEGA